MSNHHSIPEKWVVGGVGDAGALHTDGQRIFSYSLCIGTTSPDGRKVVLESPASVTTARHVNGAKRVADEFRRVEGHGWGLCFGVCRHARAIEEDTTA